MQQPAQEDDDGTVRVEVNYFSYGAADSIRPSALDEGVRSMSRKLQRGR